MDAHEVAIKGIRDGLLIALGAGELDAQVDSLTGRLQEQGQFFQGAHVTLDAGSHKLGTAELEALQALLAGHDMELRVVLSEDQATQDAARQVKLGTRLPGSGTELVGGQPVVRTEPAEAVAAVPVETEGVLIRGALRSGRLVSSPGHVTVIGDVNPGAEIIAGGEVVVWGKLRGLVHAGAYGDREAVVCALELAPTQLRIADLITVSPPGPRDRRPVPEMASIKNGQIVAESWDAGYRGRR